MPNERRLSDIRADLFQTRLVWAAVAHLPGEREPFAARFRNSSAYQLRQKQVATSVVFGAISQPVPPIRNFRLLLSTGRNRRSRVERRFVSSRDGSRRKVAMTRTLLSGAIGLSLVLLAGCTSGPLGPRTAYTPVPPSRTGQPVSHPPIATQPVITPTGLIGSGSASSVRVIPGAALPRHAMVQVQQGLQFGSQAALQTGIRPLAMLASNGQMIDGRPMPVIDSAAQMPRNGGARPRREAVGAASTGLPSSSARVPDLPATPQEDLKYRGGRIIRAISTFMSAGRTLGIRRTGRASINTSPPRWRTHI